MSVNVYEDYIYVCIQLYCTHIQNYNFYYIQHGEMLEKQLLMIIIIIYIFMARDTICLQEKHHFEIILNNYHNIWSISLIV